MINQTVKCKVITPMFSRGAQPARNGVYPFELRPQSVKGVLRFWFRALAPLVIDVNYLDVNKLAPKEREIWKDEKSYPGLKYLESKIFGSQHNKAPFGLTVNWNVSQVRQVVTTEITTNKQGKRIYKPKFNNNVLPKQIAYSFYGTYSIDRKTGESEIYSCLLPSSNNEPDLFICFNVHIPNKDKEQGKRLLNVLLHVLRIVSVFSGFGAKTHKGYGEFEVIRKKFDRDPHDPHLYIKEAMKALEEFINHSDFSDALKLERTELTRKVEDFPTFTSYFFKPLQIEGRDWIEVMYQLYLISNDSKGWYPSLKQQLRKYGEDTVKKLIKLMDGEEKGSLEITPSILGLPLQYQNLKTNRAKNKITFFSHVETENKFQGRKSSPMFISIHRKPDGKWQPWVLILRSKITQSVEGKPILEKSLENDFEALGFEDYEALENLISNGE